jgi:hypothetical protein
MAAALVFVPGAWAQTYSLAETPRPGDYFRVQLDMTLTGEIRVTKEDKVVPLPLAAAAKHAFPERVLAVDANGLPQKVARVYETAQAAITVGRDRSERRLRPERRLLVAQRHKDQPLVYCPAGALTRAELELTGDHFDTLHLTGLLPGREVKVGETWKVGNTVAQALCNYEGLTGQDLVCQLEEVKDNVARITVTGTASGIDLGALVKLTIQATCRYDLGQRRLTALEWNQQDERGQGPASPASKVEMSLTLKRTPVEPVPALSDVALVSVPDGFEPPAPLTHLYHRDPKDRFDLYHGREWQMVGQTDDHLVLRLMERGDFIAQATISPWTRAPEGQHLSAESFQEAMANTPGWESDQVLQTGEVPSDGSRWVYRISALGRMDGLKVMQNFYLIAGPKGDQVVVTFTMTPAQAEKLGTRDLSLVGGLDLPAATKEGAPAK